VEECFARIFKSFEGFFALEDFRLLFIFIGPVFLDPKTFEFIISLLFFIQNFLET